MEKAFNFSGMKKVFCVNYQILISFFEEPPATSKTFATLSEKELSHLLEQRHS